MNETLEKTCQSSIKMKIKHHLGTSTKERYNRKINYSRLRTKPVLKNYSEDKDPDIVLACEPYAGDNYHFYDDIVELVEGKNFQIYSPDKDNNTDKIDFMVNKAIPKAKGILIHLNPYTKYVNQFLITTIEYNKPFIMIYSEDAFPIGKNIETRIKSSPNFINEIRYYSEENAIKLLDIHIEELLKNERL
ncbi:MAG: hypothetical protein AABY22_08820 [Nanoarchaeota archaeon]